MGIAEKVARHFSDGVRSRGQSYFMKGRVTVIAARAGEVIARVRGTAKYRVRLRMRGSKLLVSCTCPYFNPQGEPCKHLWATLLLAEGRGFLESPPVFPVHLVTENPRRVRTGGLGGLPDIRNEPPLHEASEPSETAGLDLGMEMIGLGPSRPTGPVRHDASGAKGKDRRARRDVSGEPPNWSKSGQSPRNYRGGARGRSKIKAPGVDRGSGPSRTRAINRNAKRLLVYVLDVTATLAQNQIIVDLARRQRRTTGEWGPLRPWYYAPHAAHVKYDPEDGLILALLDEAQGITTHGGYSAASGLGTAPAPPPVVPARGITNGADEVSRPAGSYSSISKALCR